MAWPSEFEERIGPWHQWFAWFPVLTDRGWRWLATVKRARYRTKLDLNGIPRSRWCHRSILLPGAA